MKKKYNKTNRALGIILSGFCLATPGLVQADSYDSALMRMVCVDAEEFDSGQSTNIWAVVITQIINETYKADIFIPQDDGSYADKFPMFENTMFFVSISRNSPEGGSFEDGPTFAEQLLEDSQAAKTVLSEGNRVGTLLDLNWDATGSFQYDSKDQSKNAFVDAESGEKRNLRCGKPFAFMPS